MRALRLILLSAIWFVPCLGFAGDVSYQLKASDLKISGQWETVPSQGFEESIQDCVWTAPGVEQAAEELRTADFRWGDDAAWPRTREMFYRNEVQFVFSMSICHVH